MELKSLNVSSRATGTKGMAHAVRRTGGVPGVLYGGGKETVALEVDGADQVVRAAIALFGLGSVPRRASAAEAAVTERVLGEIDADDVGRTAIADLDDVPADLHGSAAYRTRVGAVMVARAWAGAAAEATGGAVDG
mgnify:CR=1 FL=1